MTPFGLSRYGENGGSALPTRLTRGDTAGVPIAKFVARGAAADELRIAGHGQNSLFWRGFWI